MRKDIEPPLDPPEEVVIGTCIYCEEEIFQGEDVRKVESKGILHEECLVDYAVEELDAPKIIGASKEDIEGI